MNQGRSYKSVESSYKGMLFGLVGLIFLTIFLAIMTKFQIKREGLIIGFEEHTKAGPVYWYNEGLTIRDELPGHFPLSETDEKILVSEKEPNRREEKR